MGQILDADIGCVRAPNPILDRIAEQRLAKAKVLYTPGLPLSVIRRAQEAATSTGVTFLLLVGLAAKLTRSTTVRISPTLREQAGLSEDQVKRAAVALASAGLIEVTSSSGKRREITVRDEEFVKWLRAGEHGTRHG